MLITASARSPEWRFLGADMLGATVVDQIVVCPLFRASASVATKNISDESGVQVNQLIQSSIGWARFLFSPVALSKIISRNRSLSSPGRCCARYAIHFPSGEYKGFESLAGLSTVMFFVFARTSAGFAFASQFTGTIHRSLLVEIASTLSWFEA